MYVELHHVNKATGLCDRTEYELYNLKKDPYELENIAVNPSRKKPSAVQKGLAARLATLRNCAGASRPRHSAPRPNPLRVARSAGAAPAAPVS